mmetsp:Transcript_20408/g.33169  ORF Transcript_20408/g.33169 Transcript_20408/m.33169 type:complete len:91 (+) Transcript_20408:119-391(+)
MMNACDEDVMYGAYDQGSAPTVALCPQVSAAAISSNFSSSATSRDNTIGKFAIIELHEGYKGGADMGNCGLPVARPDSLVLDGWQLANLD